MVEAAPIETWAKYTWGSDGAGISSHASHLGWPLCITSDVCCCHTGGSPSADSGPPSGPAGCAANGVGAGGGGNSAPARQSTGSGLILKLSRMGSCADLKQEHSEGTRPSSSTWGFSGSGTRCSVSSPHGPDSDTCARAAGSEGGNVSGTDY